MTYGPVEPGDPWGGQNPYGCCQDHYTEGGRLTHGGPDCVWPGPVDVRGNPIPNLPTG